MIDTLNTTAVLLCAAVILLATGRAVLAELSCDDDGPLEMTQRQRAIYTAVGVSMVILFVSLLVVLFLRVYAELG